MKKIIHSINLGIDPNKINSFGDKIHSRIEGLDKPLTARVNTDGSFIVDVKKDGKHIFSFNHDQDFEKGIKELKNILNEDKSI